MQIDMLASKVSLDLQYMVIQCFPFDFFPAEVLMCVRGTMLMLHNAEVHVHNADVLGHRDI